MNKIEDTIVTLTINKVLYKDSIYKHSEKLMKLYKEEINKRIE
ncbi:MAG: hypothetical protein R6V23_04080 [Bacteroidales bacterium]